MIRKTFSILAAVCAASTAGAQDAETESILAEAQGHLHLTCNTIVEQFGQSEDKLLDTVGLMVAVSLNNRGIDFLKLDLTDQETDEIQAEFADQIGDACAEDADQLMAGIVDRVVAELVQFY
ncbi:hypothetical protein SAMN05444007_11369 [Cribrihabitans marinus]|uniref:YmgD protein n=1 Tax=Cribrihabitans marinus TaxID=1227549 RepID=A0A1H7DZC7_9RHOB|nr:hypothetical protein [Cribrihabitans marinus]GGH40033.1 hypothetical protein GCM10010973_36240 [Cribrihabitans marinus]SEK04680.1 hypothetical protein SAMN05444007_11369 [Cribrihabitans marinus]